jgi:hypothetical protein
MPFVPHNSAPLMKGSYRVGKVFERVRRENKVIRMIFHRHAVTFCDDVSARRSIGEIGELAPKRLP